MFGSGELLLILGVILLLFGGKKLPEFAKNLGAGIREFKRACNGDVDPQEPETQPEAKEIAPTSSTDEHPR